MIYFFFNGTDLFRTCKCGISYYSESWFPFIHRSLWLRYSSRIGNESRDTDLRLHRLICIQGRCHCGTGSWGPSQFSTWKNSFIIWVLSHEHHQLIKTAASWLSARCSADWCRFRFDEKGWSRSLSSAPRSSRRSVCTSAPQRKEVSSRSTRSTLWEEESNVVWNRDLIRIRIFPLIRLLT